MRRPCRVNNRSPDWLHWHWVASREMLLDATSHETIFFRTKFPCNQLKMYNYNTFVFVDVVGILDVDWQSLMSTGTATKPKPSVHTDALDRFSPANILSRIGISKKYAGQQRVEQVQNLLRQHHGRNILLDSWITTKQLALLLKEIWLLHPNTIELC